MNQRMFREIFLSLFLFCVACVGSDQQDQEGLDDLLAQCEANTDACSADTALLEQIDRAAQEEVDQAQDQLSTPSNEDEVEYSPLQCRACCRVKYKSGSFGQAFCLITCDWGYSC